MRLEAQRAGEYVADLVVRKFGLRYTDDVITAIKIELSRELEKIGRTRNATQQDFINEFLARLRSKLEYLIGDIEDSIRGRTLSTLWDDEEEGGEGDL